MYIWEILILQKKKLFTRNSNFTGCPVIVFAKPGNPTLRSQGHCLDQTPPLPLPGTELALSRQSH